MKKALMLVFACFTAFTFQNCTNDEGDEDIDVITPNDTEENLLMSSEGQKENI